MRQKRELTNEEIWDLRVKGYSYSDIQSIHGIDKSAAYLACYEVFEYRREKLHDDKEMTVLLELCRLDAMLKALWPKLEDESLSINTVKSILAIMERRASYLGLDNSGLKDRPQDSAREIYEHMQQIVSATGYGWQ